MKNLPSEGPSVATSEVREVAEDGAAVAPTAG